MLTYIRAYSADIWIFEKLLCLSILQKKDSENGTDHQEYLQRNFHKTAFVACNM